LADLFDLELAEWPAVVNRQIMNAWKICNSQQQAPRTVFAKLHLTDS